MAEPKRIRVKLTQDEISDVVKFAKAKYLDALEKGLQIESSTDDQMTVEEWLAIRKEAGLTIDPETAEVTWTYAQILDPYGVDPDLPQECYQVGRVYFARSPERDIWVCFYDLPTETSHRLWEKLERRHLARVAEREETPS